MVEAKPEETQSIEKLLVSIEGDKEATEEMNKIIKEREAKIKMWESYNKMTGIWQEVV